MPPIPSRSVSGRYRGRHDRYEIELRIDIDGPRPTRQISADYSLAQSGKRRGSMRLVAPNVTTTRTHLVITGTGSFTWLTTARRMRITVPRAANGSAPARATVQHLTADGQAAATYRCVFVSPAFRTVQLEEAVQRGVAKLESYDTAALAHRGRPRMLSYVGAFAEAGIELVAHAPTVVEMAPGADPAWSDAELHGAMEHYFTEWANRPEWSIWLMHATRHESSALDGPDDGAMQGLMFDRRGAQRQGCAVFYDTMPGTGPLALRNQLYTCVHELAHGFNLVHSWQKSLARPPAPSRPAALSWMNYPYRYPGGEAAFWPAFGFEFDDAELAHLRHAYREDVIMGGSPFLAGAALERAPGWGRPPADADPGLRLTLTMARTFAYGVPVTADLAMSATAAEGRRTHTVLGPRSATADIAISRVGHDALVFEPLLRHCRGGETVLLRPGDPPIRDAALLHYGKDGYPFRKPGSYDVQARHTTPDGSIVLSDVARIRVAAPRSEGEVAVGRLTYGEEQSGALLSLMGSDAPQLRRGNRALAQIIDRHPQHPMAAIARLAQGTNAARAFKTISARGPVGVRGAQPARALALIDPVIDVARLNRALAAATKSGGGRRALAAALATVGTRPGIDPSVLAFLRTRVGELATQLPTIASAPVPPRTDPVLPPPPVDGTLHGLGEKPGEKPVEKPGNASATTPGQPPPAPCPWPPLFGIDLCRLWAALKKLLRWILTTLRGRGSDG